jgi:sugar lactone lactonase YvrE
MYDGPEVAVTALTTDSDGNLYAGVSPGGRVYRFGTDGKRTTILDKAIPLSGR